MSHATETGLGPKSAIQNFVQRPSTTVGRPPLRRYTFSPVALSTRSANSSLRVQGPVICLTSAPVGLIERIAQWKVSGSSEQSRSEDELEPANRRPNGSLRSFVGRPVNVIWRRKSSASFLRDCAARRVSPRVLAFRFIGSKKVLCVRAFGLSCPQGAEPDYGPGLQRRQGRAAVTISWLGSSARK